MLAALGLFKRRKTSNRLLQRKERDDPPNSRALRNIEGGCGRAHTTEVAVIQLLPKKYKKDLIYAELVSWEIPILERMGGSKDEFVVLAICTSVLVILRLKRQPVKGVATENQSKHVQPIPWVAIQDISIDNTNVPLNATAATAALQAWHGQPEDEGDTVPCHRISLRFRAFKNENGDPQFYHYNSFVKIDFNSFRATASSKLGNTGHLLRRTWHEDILRAMQNIKVASDIEFHETTAKVRYVISMGDIILSKFVDTGLCASQGLHYDSANGIHYAPDYSFTEESHIIERVATLTLNDGEVTTALLQSERLVIHVLKFLLSCARAGDRVARAGKDPSTGVAGKDSLKNAKMEEERSILGQAGGRRLVWASLCFFHCLMFGMNADQAFMFLPYSNDLLEAFSADFSPRLRISEASGYGGNFLNQAIRRIQLAVMVQLCCDVSVAELKADVLDPNLLSEIELDRFGFATSLRCTVGWSKSFLLPSVVFNNISIFLDGIHATRVLQRAIKEKGYAQLRECFSRGAVAALSLVDPKIVAKGRKILNEENTNHLKLAVQTYLGNITGESSVGLGQVVIPNGGNQRKRVQMLRRKSSVNSEIKSPTHCHHSVLARAIRTAEHAGFVDNEVAERARELSHSAWEMQREDEEEAERIVFESALGFFQIMAFSFPGAHHGKYSYGAGWRRKGLDGRFTLVANWVNASQSFEHDEDEVEQYKWGSGGAGSNLKGREAFHDSHGSARASHNEMVLRLRLRGVSSASYEVKPNDPWEDEIFVRWDPSCATLMGSFRNGDQATFHRLGTHQCDNKVREQIDSLLKWADKSRNDAAKEIKEKFAATGRRENLITTVAVAEREALIEEDELARLKKLLSMQSTEARAQVATNHLKFWVEKVRQVNDVFDIASKDEVFHGLRKSIKGTKRESSLFALAQVPVAAHFSDDKKRCSESSSKRKPFGESIPNVKRNVVQSELLVEAEELLEKLASARLQNAMSIRIRERLRRTIALTEGIVKDKSIIDDAKARLASLENPSSGPAVPVRNRRRAGMQVVSAIGIGAKDDDRQSKAEALQMTRFPAMSPSAALHYSLRLFEIMLRASSTNEILRGVPINSWHPTLCDNRVYRKILDGGPTIDAVSREKLDIILDKLRKAANQEVQRAEVHVRRETLQLAGRSEIRAPEQVVPDSLGQQQQQKPHPPSKLGQMRRSVRNPRFKLR